MSEIHKYRFTMVVWSGYTDLMDVVVVSETESDAHTRAEKLAKKWMILPSKMKYKVRKIEEIVT